jgi:hypothetical protein
VSDPVNDIDADVLRRHFVAIATSDYDDPTHRALPSVIDEVKTLKDWLCDHRLAQRAFTHQYPHLATNPTKEQVRDAFEKPEELWNHSDAAVVFVTGHGMVGHGVHWVVLKNTNTGQLRRTALRTADLVGWLAEAGIEHLLVILDLCYAGRTAVEAADFDADFPPTWLALASVTSHQQAQTGALTAAISEFLADLASPIGEQFNHGPYLRVDQFLDAIQTKLAKFGGEQRLAHLHPGLPSLVESPCLPNPRYRPEQQTVQSARRDLALRPEDLEAHWDPRARGVATAAESGWLFTGRTELMRRLIQATKATTGNIRPIVVSGAAGTGKSAVLARLVTLSDTAFCERFAAMVHAVPTHLRPEPGAVDVAVLATGKVPHEVMGQVYEASTGSRPTTASVVPTLDELRTAWWSWLQMHGRTITVVVDALDEAKNPHVLLTDVLTQLNPPAPASPRVRLIVGVRSPGGTDDATGGTADPPRERPLADAAEHLLDAERLPVDEAPWWRPEDLADYATELLAGLAGSPYAGPEHRPRAEQIARKLAAHAGKSFLITRIAATSLAQRQEQIDPDDPTWQATLADGVLGVFRDDLHATLPDPADRERAIHLLRAVAFAYGRGLPWRHVWPLVANAVADEPARYGDSDIAWLLGSRLGAYLVTDREDDITVYRLFHDALRSTLRERADALLHRDEP